MTQERRRAWLRAHHSASCLPRAWNPGGLSSPLPACWVNIVISTVPPAWTAWPGAPPRVTGLWGDRGTERSLTARKMTQDPKAAGGAAESQEPNTASPPPSPPHP